MENQKFIVTIASHRVLGTVLSPCIIERMGGANSFVIRHVLTKQNSTGFEPVIGKAEMEIIDLMDKYSDKSLMTNYSREKTVKDFYANLKQEKLNNIIRPYVEKKIVECLRLLYEKNTPIYKKDKKFSNIYEDDKLILESEPTFPVFNFEKTEEGLIYFLNLNHQGKKLNLTNKKVQILTNSPCWLILGNQLLFIKDIDGKKLLPFFTKKYISIPKTAEKKYFETFILNALRSYPVEVKGFDILTDTTKPLPLLSLEESLNGQACFILKFQYKNRVFMANNKQDIFVSLVQEEGNYSYTKFIRDKVGEEKINAFLRKLGLDSKDGIRLSHRTGRNRRSGETL